MASAGSVPLSRSSATRSELVDVLVEVELDVLVELDDEVEVDDDVEVDDEVLVDVEVEVEVDDDVEVELEVLVEVEVELDVDEDVDVEDDVEVDDEVLVEVLVDVVKNGRSQIKERFLAQSRLAHSPGRNPSSSAWKGSRRGRVFRRIQYMSTTWAKAETRLCLPRMQGRCAGHAIG